MPVINRIADYTDEMQTWRRHLHENPELMFECHNTAAFIAQKLRDFGVDALHEGIATTGLVGIIKGRGEGPTTTGSKKRRAAHAAHMPPPVPAAARSRSVLCCDVRAGLVL